MGVIIMSRLIRDNRDYQVEFIAHAVEDGRVLAQATVECSICGQQELLDAIPAKLTELDAKLAQALAAQTWPPRLMVAGTPSHASLSLDGEDIGPGPISVEVEPGKHQLEIAAVGYATQLHRWAAVEGVEQQIEFSLTRQPANRGLKIAGWAAVALGGVGTTTGITLISLNGRDHAPTCATNLRDPSGDCPNVYATAAAGVITLGVGVAAIATGVGLLVHRHQGQRQTKPSSARVSVGVGAGGIQLRF
ncbi:hypothetical protein DB30_04535 [Enhygromyxa salina]|uniref:PEGA domain-containing protein n=1 Tax=Enhygromyxa salina TaxID=215803 RepID=A0A0C1ZYQ3_9BACT|nr:hypothetical protein DB30_04535 [Enhygromyxa salina]